MAGWNVPCANCHVTIRLEALPDTGADYFCGTPLCEERAAKLRGPELSDEDKADFEEARLAMRNKPTKFQRRRAEMIEARAPTSWGGWYR